MTQMALGLTPVNKDNEQDSVENKNWKPVNSKEKIKNGTRKLSDALFGNDMLKRLVVALRTKPFAILAGHSGTGNSQLVRRLAYMTRNVSNIKDTEPAINFQFFGGC